MLRRRLLTLLFAFAVTTGCASATARVLRDGIGRRVQVPDQAHSIICLAPNLTETVYALGLWKEVAGVTNYTDYPPEARLKPHVGGLIDPSLEKIVSLHPDLVLADAGINRQQTVEQLEHLHIPVFVVRPQGLKGVLKSIREIGEATGRQAAAANLVKDLQAKEKQIADRVQGLPRPKVFVLIWYQPVITAGRTAFVTDVISAAGGRSVTADIPQAWPQISMERVLQLSPDFLLLVRGGGHGGVSLGMLRASPGWRNVQAVQRGRVIYMDDRLFHASPVVFDALAELAKKLHPSAF
jgi:iron complex transport system substrate-binding protein